MLAILPLVMVAITPALIDDADASGGHSGVQAKLSAQEAAPELTAELSLVQVIEPQETNNSATQTTKGFVPKSADNDAKTFSVVYRVVNAADSDVQNVEISVSSDTETVIEELQGNLAPKHSVVSVMIKATDPASINAEIVDFDFKN